ncbi:hypothetical protein ACMA5I_15240 [Paracoccaceae bacterium GXU_MW_L88]
MESKENFDTFSKKAGLYVTKASVWFVVLLFGLTVAQLAIWYFIQFQMGKYTSSVFANSCQDTECAIIALEAIVQQTRGVRALDLVASRHVITLVAITVSLAVSVLGAVLIFDRIETATSGSVNVLRKKEGGSEANEDSDSVPENKSGRGTVEITPTRFYIESSFPGLMMCGLATFIIFAALNYSHKTANTQLIRDVPVFLSDKNHCRNIVGRVAGITSENSGGSQSDLTLKNEDEFKRLFQRCVLTEMSIIPSAFSVDRDGDLPANEAIFGEGE